MMSIETKQYHYRLFKTMIDAYSPSIAAIFSRQTTVRILRRFVPRFGRLKSASALGSITS